MAAWKWTTAACMKQSRQLDLTEVRRSGAPEVPPRCPLMKLNWHLVLPALLAFVLSAQAAEQPWFRRSLVALAVTLRVRSSVARRMTSASPRASTGGHSPRHQSQWRGVSGDLDPRRWTTITTVSRLNDAAPVSRPRDRSALLSGDEIAVPNGEGLKRRRRNEVGPKLPRLVLAVDEPLDLK